jgi:hypothetical protein
MPTLGRLRLLPLKRLNRIAAQARSLTTPSSAMRLEPVDLSTRMQALSETSEK